MTTTQQHPALPETNWTPFTGAIAAWAGGLILAFGGMDFPRFVPVWVPLTLAAMGIVAAWVAHRRHHTLLGNLIYRVVCWAGGALWATGTIMWGIGWTSFLIFTVAAVGGALFSPLFGPHRVRPVPDPEELAATAARRSMTVEERWARRFVQHCDLKRRPDRVVKLSNWKQGSGITLYVEFAEGTSTTWHAIRDAACELAAAARLEPGCTVMAEAATRDNVPAGTGLPVHQGAAVVHIQLVNTLPDALPFPRDYSPISIMDEFAVGRFPNYDLTTIELYRSLGLIVGRRGAGKTVLLHCITAQAHRMHDALIILIDLNGGKLCGPWVSPFARGVVTRPGVIAVAFTPAQALKIARRLLQIAQDRNLRYQHLMISSNLDVLPVSADLPAILVLVDEGGELAGDDADPLAQKAADLLRAVQRIGRAVLINVEISAQRGVAEYIPTQMKKGAALKICGRVDDADELAYVFDWKKGLDPEALLAGDGLFYIRRGEVSESIQIFKDFYLDPAQIEEICVATQTIRPPRLDPAAEEIAGDVLANWWEHPIMQWYLASLRGEFLPRPDDMELDGTDKAAISAASDAMSRVDADLSEVNSILDSFASERDAAPTQTATAVLEDEQLEQQAEQQQATASREGDAEAVPDHFAGTLAEIDALPVAEPVRPVRQQADPVPELDVDLPEPVAQLALALRRAAMTSAAGRKLGLSRMLAAAGPEGLRTKQILAAVELAGINVTRDTVHRWLSEVAEDAGHGRWRASDQAAR